MNEVEKRSNMLGLIVLFVVFTAFGTFLSFFYVVFHTNTTDIWANIIGTFVLSGALGLVAWLIKRLFKITNNALSLLVVGVGLVIILYVMWSTWFVFMEAHLIFGRELYGLRDMGTVFSDTRSLIFGNYEYGFMDYLRLFNTYGTWSINNNDWYGARLWAVWGGETLIVISIPLMLAYASAGLYIQELGAWAEERLMNYGFTAFDDHELDRIGMGDVEPILEKPLETRNGPMNAIAVCYHKGEATDYIAVYKAHWDKEGALGKGRHIMTVNLGADKIDALDTGLQAKHYPSMAKKADELKNENESATDTAVDTLEVTDEITEIKDEVITDTAEVPEVDTTATVDLSDL